MRRFLAILPLAIALVFTTACGDTVTGPTTVVNFTLPPFGAREIRLRPGDWGGNILTLYGLDTKPSIEIRNSATGVVALDPERWEVQIDPVTNRNIWTLQVTFRVIGTGTSTISVSLRGQPDQVSAFQVTGDWNAYGGGKG